MKTNVGKIGFGQEFVEYGGLKRSVAFSDSYQCAEKLEFSAPRTMTSFFEIPEGVGLIAINESGAALVRSESSSRWYLAPPNSVGVCFGPRGILARASKGDHLVLAHTWELASTLGLSAALASLAAERATHSLVGLPIRAITPHFDSGYRRLRRAYESEGRVSSSALALSAIAEAIAYVGDSETSSTLAPTPRNLPETLQALVNAVRQAPDKPWPLKEASDEAGYSPFHFSRIFKQQTGFGFHEFVDRTRTEYAVELLFSTDEPVDAVASQSGFGTTQGLRESVKEYLGMVPTELRSEPDERLTT